MKTKLLVIASVLGTLLTAQTTATFENFNVGVNSFLNGSTVSGGFEDGNLRFPNTYDAGFNSWYGFAISSKTDVTTAGFTNEFSSIAGTGYNGSNQYGVAYMSYLTNNAVMTLENNASGKALEGMYVNNSTYAFLSMRDGDGVAKNFGGITGNDPDFFLLTIKKYLDGIEGSELIEFYLADYRFSDNTQDYIIQDWTYIDLSVLGNADSVSFSLSSSDVGQFGMNTPAYFCLDNVTTKDELATGIRAEFSSLNISIFPNPVMSKLNFEMNANDAFTVRLVNSLGVEILAAYVDPTNNEIDLAYLPEGLYFLYVVSKEGVRGTKTILKKS